MRFAHAFVTQVSLRWRELARDPRLWRRLLRAQFDLRYEPPPGTPGAHFQAQFRELRASERGDAPRPLRFRGVFTDGGCDSGDGRYWVDAMFSAADYEAYWCVAHAAHSASRLHRTAACLTSPTARTPDRLLVRPSTARAQLRRRPQRALRGGAGER
jgi:hypothetical protein